MDLSIFCAQFFCLSFRSKTDSISTILDSDHSPIAQTFIFRVDLKHVRLRLFFRGRSEQSLSIGIALASLTVLKSCRACETTLIEPNSRRFFPYLVACAIVCYRHPHSTFFDVQSFPRIKRSTNNKMLTNKLPEEVDTLLAKGQIPIIDLAHCGEYRALSLRNI